MHGVGFGATLQKYAAQVPADQAIVEVGSWMGGSAFHLATASAQQPLHLYDRWRANQSEVDKLAERGLPGVEIGEDLLPRVRKNLSGFGGRIHYHKTEDVADCVYKGPPIGLYVDDASKNNFQQVISRFASSLAPGCIAILMDYKWPPCFIQREAVARMGWTLIDDDTEDLATCIFRTS